MHASYIYMRPGDLTEYVNTTFNLYFLIIFSLIFLISLRTGGGVHPHYPTSIRTRHRRRHNYRPPTPIERFSRTYTTLRGQIVRLIPYKQLCTDILQRYNIRDVAIYDRELEWVRERERESAEQNRSVTKITNTIKRLVSNLNYHHISTHYRGRLSRCPE